MLTGELEIVVLLLIHFGVADDVLALGILRRGLLAF